MYTSYCIFERCRDSSPPPPPPSPPPNCHQKDEKSTFEVYLGIVLFVVILHSWAIVALFGAVEQATLHVSGCDSTPSSCPHCHIELSDGYLERSCRYTAVYVACKYMLYMSLPSSIWWRFFNVEVVTQGIEIIAGDSGTKLSRAALAGLAHITSD